MSKDQVTFGERLIAAAEEAARFARGEATGARVWQVYAPDVPAIRKKLGLSQEEFAQRFRISIATLRNWEQGARRPEGPARVLLAVIDKEPEAVARALEAMRPRVGGEARRKAAAAAAEPVRRARSARPARKRP